MILPTHGLAILAAFQGAFAVQRVIGEPDHVIGHLALSLAPESLGHRGVPNVARFGNTFFPKNRLQRLSIGDFPLVKTENGKLQIVRCPFVAAILGRLIEALNKIKDGCLSKALHFPTNERNLVFSIRTVGSSILHIFTGVY